MEPVGGSMRLRSCFGVTFSIYYIFKFAVGSVVYLRYKAQEGILEAIAIKKVYLNGPNKVVFYNDSLNAMYAEDELVTYNQAVAIAKAYYEHQLGEIDAALAQICDWH